MMDKDTSDWLTMIIAFLAAVFSYLAHRRGIQNSGTVDTLHDKVERVSSTLHDKMDTLHDKVDTIYKKMPPTQE